MKKVDCSVLYERKDEIAALTLNYWRRMFILCTL